MKNCTEFHLNTRISSEYLETLFELASLFVLPACILSVQFHVALHHILWHPTLLDPTHIHAVGVHRRSALAQHATVRLRPDLTVQQSSSSNLIYREIQIM